MTTPNHNNQYDRIYLSPHLDDAVLSCGGRIYQEIAQGVRVLIVTLAAGEPRAEIRSSFAQFQHHNWGLDASEVIDARRAEDIAACRVLGADYVHWSLPDCIYRIDPASGEPLYTSEKDIFGEIDPAELPLVERLAEKIGSLPPDAQLLVPLTLGNHVDHQLTRAAAERQSGRSLVYYEDYPYIQRHPETLAALVSPESAWQAEVVPLSRAALEARIEASRQYRSQIGQLFDDGEGMVSAVRRQVAATGGERFWHSRQPV